MKIRNSAAALTLLVGLASRVEATPITIGFEGPTEHIFLYETYEEAGFRLIPGCHYHIIPSSAGQSSEYSPFETNWFSSDPSGCQIPGNETNPGIGISTVRLDANGALFDLLSVGAVRIPPRVTASNGAIGSLCSPEELGGILCAGTVAFEGHQWRNLEWVDFTFDLSAAPIGGIDNIVVHRVPEPASFFLLTSGLVLLTWRKRGKR
jgi:hypothetical protein